jgi:hypothetical protein
VDVVRHDDVAVDVEEIFLTGLFKDFYESAAGFCGAENVALADAAESDEVKVSSFMVSVQAQRHEMSLAKTVRACQREYPTLSR